MDQIALIKAAQSGDSKAFARVLEAQYDTIFRVALRWCGNRPDAEDIAQQACIKLARGIDQYKFEAAFTSWLYRLVINCAKDWQRQQARHRDTNEELRETPSTEDKAELAIYLQQVLTWVGRIGEEFKETLILVFGEGLSHGEAAEILQVKESTISWRIHNVRKKLQDLHAQEQGVNNE